MENLEIQRKIQSLEQDLIPWKSELKRFSQQRYAFSKHIKEVQKEIDDLRELLQVKNEPI